MGYPYLAARLRNTHGAFVACNAYFHTADGRTHTDTVTFVPVVEYVGLCDGAGDGPCG